MGFRDWLGGLLGREAVKAVPPAINPDAPERVRLAISRLDAITRAIEGKGGRGNVPDQRMREYRAEARVQAAFLLMSGRIDEGEHDRLLIPILGED